MLNSRDSNSFWPAYQGRWARLLCGQTEGLGAWIESTLRALARGELEVADIAVARGALDDLHARLKRLETLRADPTAAATGTTGDTATDTAGETALDTVTREHFAAHGAAILGAPDAFGGGDLRYGEVRGLLENLKTWLGALELSSHVVLGLPDRDSQIIGRALALRLKVRYADANGEGLNQPEAVIVAADSRALKASSLATIFPDQVVFAFNLHRAGGTVAPDVAALATPALVLPWHLETPLGASEDDEDEAPLREASSVAAQIAATRAISAANWPARLEFYRVRASLLAAGNPRFSRLPMLPEGV